ncbi:hypothetical protein [Streptomyces sp. TRM70350]|uniref:hypothetical protein n=1 Tax=Streptomyces sp. TRM70350 TaxID=2856165 RepID=UPI001C446981|nr:hypothetical protein [Streptomyces sp. TRM70350]MBV7699685.1 hypothetical protein [Streptomyces sp. TRM70350]
MVFDVDEGAGSWEDVVGRRFVEALNEGLVREAARRRGSAQRPDGPTRSSGPFEAAVLASFDAALNTALAADERDDTALRAALGRRARQILSGAASAGHLSEDVLGPAGESPLSPERDILVVTLLMECVMLAALESRPSSAAAGQAAGLVQALSRSVRASRTLTRSA